MSIFNFGERVPTHKCFQLLKPQAQLEDQAYPSIRGLFRASVYPLTETGALTCFVGGPEV